MRGHFPKHCFLCSLSRTFCFSGPLLLVPFLALQCYVLLTVAFGTKLWEDRMKAGAMSVFLHFLETTSSFDQKGNFPTLKILCSLGLLLQQLMLTSPRPSMAKGPGPERTEKENRCDFAHSELGDLFPTPRARTRMSGGPVVHSSDLECRRLHRGTLAGGAVLSLGRWTPGDKPVVTSPQVQCTAEPGFPPAFACCGLLLGILK